MQGSASALFVVFLLIFGCLSSTSKDLVCNKPYIRHGTSCCLDVDGNSICDADERAVVPQVAEKDDNFATAERLVGEANNETLLGNEKFSAGNGLLALGNYSEAVKEFGVARDRYQKAKAKYDQACQLSSQHCYGDSTEYLAECSIPTIDIGTNIALSYNLSETCVGPTCPGLLNASCQKLLQDSATVDLNCNMNLKSIVLSHCGAFMKSNEYFVYIDELPFGVDSEYRDTIYDAFEYWESRDGVKFSEVSSESQATMQIQWIKEFGGEPLGQAYLGGSFGQVGLGDSYCLGKWRPYNYETVKSIAIHEFGHLLGHDHTDDPTDIMYPTHDTSYDIAVEEDSFLPDGAYAFYPACVLTTRPILVDIESTVPLNIYVVPSQEEYDKFTDGEEFSYYPGCNAEKVESFSKTCDVGAGSGVILYNPTIFGHGEDAQFELRITHS